MKKTQIFAAAAAVSIASAAQALPIVFEFSGTVQQISLGAEQWHGQRATGRFEFDPDNFSLLPVPGTNPNTIWTDALPHEARPEPLTANLSVGSDFISLNSEVEVYGGIHFIDACRPDCVPQQAESWGISANTQSYPLGSSGWTSGYSLSSLSFRSSTPFSWENPQSFDFFDIEGSSPESVLTLPLVSLVGNYGRSVYQCREAVGEDEDPCTVVSQVSMYFVVDSVTRTLISQSVPEPGTLGLLGIGLLGGAFTRRRAMQN